MDSLQTADHANMHSAETRKHGHRLVWMVFLAYALNFIDRQVVSVLLEYIKEELQISDGELGLLTGLAFAAFYATISVPIAWLSDRYSRKNIIAACMALWSAMTAGFGMAQNFGQMLVTRMGVGVGEAGFAPAAFSMIADYFPREKRATAIAIAAMGAMLGTTLGLSGGGLIAEHYGWRTALLLAGGVGILFSGVFFLFVKEPPRGLSGGAAAGVVEQTGGFLSLGRNLAYVLVVLSAVCTCLVVYACLHWLPSVLIRTYSMSSGTAGLLLGPLLGGAGAASLFSSGYITDRLAKRDPRWGIWLPGVASAFAFPLMGAAFYVENPVWTLILFGLGYYCAMFFSAPTTAMIQYLVQTNLRARATAIYLLVTTLVGFGIGPVVAGFISEALNPAYGENALRYALLAMSPVLLLSPIILYFAAKVTSFEQDAEPEFVP